MLRQLPRGLYRGPKWGIIASALFSLFTSASVEARNFNCVLKVCVCVSVCVCVCVCEGVCVSDLMKWRMSNCP